MKRAGMIFSVVLTAAALVSAGCADRKETATNVAQPKQPAEKAANPVVIVETSEGAVRIELDAQRAPVTVRNFVQYAESGFYDGTIFHRVIPGFMIQGGGLAPNMKEKATRPPIRNEADNGLKNDRGTIAMARTGVVDSATSQFFINVADNAFLNHRGRSADAFGYAVFGKVVEGMDVVDRIVSVPTTTVGMHENVPVQPVLIKSVRVQK